MKWIWFAILAAVLFGAAWGALNMGWDELGSVLGVVMVIFTIAALAEFAAHYGEVGSVIFARRQEAVNTTPLVLIAEALRGLHPDNVAVLNRFAVHTVWDVQIDLEAGERDWILRGTDVHFGFIEYVLDSSQGGRLYPRNKFLEGSKKWDPMGIVEDREQHRQFELWLSTRLVVVREFGENHPAMFLPPWTPEVLKVRMGFEGMGELYKPEEAVRLKNLGTPSQPPAQTLTPSPSPRGRGEDNLSDEDMDRIKAFETAKATMSPKDYLKFCQSQS